MTTTTHRRAAWLRTPVGVLLPGLLILSVNGLLTAAFTGRHGWFWRNRTGEPVTITLRTEGAYSKIKRVV